MNEFWLWFSTGSQHILDWNGYDHILYVVTLCVMFSIYQWKNLLVLVTAFTIGHSITLAISSLSIFSVKQSYIEVLIPITILVTCIINIFNIRSLNSNQYTSNLKSVNFKTNYALALVFGLVHGMGFSYLLKSMLEY